LADAGYLVLAIGPSWDPAVDRAGEVEQMHSLKPRRVMLAMLIGLGALFGAAPPGAAAPGIQCQTMQVPVNLSSTDPTTYQLFAQVCWRGSQQGKTAQILVHGTTYDHNYWDFPANGGNYSYVRQATDEAYVTINIDRLGVGLSDHPPAEQLSIHTDSYNVHQLVQRLRSGSLTGTSFSKVMLVGNSSGSAGSISEAVHYGDIDGVVLTGILHDFAPDADTDFIASIYPAEQDPKFADAGLPEGYLTTLPGTYEPLFYYSPNADPAVIAKDEELKQTISSGQLWSFFDALQPGFTNRIHVPVLLLMGEFDDSYCSDDYPILSCDSAETLLNREVGHYAADACLEAFVQNRAGHKTNLHRNAGQGYDAILDWTTKRVGTPGAPPTDPCEP
jgi:pimeloyl-ACP methyl ester carboxylesterase